MDFGIILTTTSSINEAKKIAHKLVESKLAACANIIPKIISIYTWKEELNEDEEYLLLIKTRQETFEDVKREILNLHSYELPEIIMIPIEQGLGEYLSWIKTATERKIAE